jgi:hypothetical protein
VAHRRTGRARHPRVRRLVQPPPPIRGLRRRPTRRTRGRSLSPTSHPRRGWSLKPIGLRTRRGLQARHGGRRAAAEGAAAGEAPGSAIERGQRPGPTPLAHSPPPLVAARLLPVGIPVVSTRWVTDSYQR